MRGQPSTRPELRVLGEFGLLYGGAEIVVRPASQRLLAYLAVTAQQARDAVAARLWPDHDPPHAHGCLRSALWRLPKPNGIALVCDEGGRLRLNPGVMVDLDSRRAEAETVLLADSASAGAAATFAAELLPAWYDDWLVIDRERYRQLRLHALEHLSELWAATGRYAAAIDAGLLAVAGEPLRESAHRCVANAHLAEGNRQAAAGQVEIYAELLRQAELPIQLPSWMTALIADRRASAGQV